MVAWGTPQFSIETYDLEKDAKSILIPAHSSTIFSCRHYLDRKNKIDMIISSSYDKSVKVWNFNNNMSCLLNIAGAHSGYYIYSACILIDEVENKNYIISSAPSEYSKIWNFQGTLVSTFGVNNESTYFISTWFYQKAKKHYIINANSSDVKVYDFKTHKLYASFKGTPHTWHMSAHIVEHEGTNYLVESDGSGNIRVWDFLKVEIVKHITTSGVNLRGLCIWNNQYVIAAGSDYNVKIYDFN